MSKKTVNKQILLTPEQEAFIIKESKKLYPHYKKQKGNITGYLGALIDREMQAKKTGSLVGLEKFYELEKKHG